MTFPVTPASVSTKRIAQYILWDGEMSVTVTQHCGAHGFFSAAIVVESCDDPIKCLTYNGYKSDLRSTSAAGYTAMTGWIAVQLTLLATGTGFAEGSVSQVVEYDSSNANDGLWEELVQDL